MKPRKKGQQWEISYRCPGYSKPISERFTSFEAAKLRIAEIEYEKSIGKLRPPKATICKGEDLQKKFITVSELMDEYVQLYGLNHWGDSFLSYSRHRIEHYIKPYLGTALVSDLTTHALDRFYDSLRDKPAVVLKGHKNDNKTVSLQVIEKVHALLRSALNQAVTWGYITTNPALNVTLPKYKPQSRAVWSAEEAQHAISLCDDPILHLAMLLALGCSMRIGEILGLTWDCVDISEVSIQNGTACACVNKELKRCDKSSLADLERRGRSNVLFVFPERKKASSTTSLVLKDPKTASSVRTVFLPKTVADALLSMKAQQDDLKATLCNAYTDFNMVLAHADGRPFEERQIADRLRNFIKKNNLPPVVFHSLRHCSTSVKLQISGGNIKTVQGDTGHAQARMVTDLYAHANTEDRRLLAQKVEQDFFQKQGRAETSIGQSATTGSDEDTATALQLLQSNPDMVKFIIAALGRTSGV